ncbi:MAG: glycosyltransferase family 2 protein [Lachnospira sp.]
MKTVKPLVTLCVIAYNEENYIDYLLSDIILQTYPKDRMEIILIDSNSTDNTKAHFFGFEQTNKDIYTNVSVYDNPARKLASGWNIALKEYKGEIIIRIDAHARLTKNFVEANIEVLDRGEYISGGRRPGITDDPTPWREALLLAEQSMFGGSIARYRNSNKKTYMKSVFHGAYRREVFEKAGMFDERLQRTEDNEMHYRIRKAGYKICYYPEIVSYEYLRKSLPDMARQKFSNGYWVTATAKMCIGAFSWFHFVPLLFVFAIIATTISALAGIPVFAEIMWILYWSMGIVLSLMAAANEKNNPFHFMLPIIFFVLHISYGMGSFIGLFSIQPGYKYKKRSVR